MLWVLAFLLATLFLPNWLESISYYWTRGHQRAAREALASERVVDLARVSRLVAESTGPSVVYIDTIRDVEQDEPEDERQLIFGGLPAQRELLGRGSGVIVDDSGYILTNFHVVAGASKIEVHLNGGRELPAEVIGVDAATDLAVLKISSGGLMAIPWGDSNQLEVGDFVWAVGSPFGLDNSVTFGIVSAKSRQGVGQARYQDYLQTCAAVNPGNSGGALVDIQGHLVGINTAIVGPTFTGISFAIPSNMAHDVYERLKKSGHYTRGWLGVQLRELTPALARELDLKQDQAGALVTRVAADTPAAAAGLEAGDLVIRWNGKEVDSPTRLSLFVAASEPDASADMVVIRKGKEQKLTVKVGKMPIQAR